MKTNPLRSGAAGLGHRITRASRLDHQHGDGSIHDVIVAALVVAERDHAKARAELKARLLAELAKSHPADLTKPQQWAVDVVNRVWSA